MKTNCIIVDDEPLAIEVIETHLSNFQNFEIIAKCKNAIEAVEYLNSHKIDLIFLDIQMPHITGINFLKTLINPPKVIITTAYREYALDGFDLDVVDYLLKPISFERFLQSINKYLEYINEKPSIDNETNIEKENFIFVKANKKNHKIYFDEILYVESLKDYISIKTINRKVVTKLPISKFEKMLPKKEFIRIHRSFIVSLKKISSFNNEIIDVEGKELPIGRLYKSQVLANLLK
jgi:DNA-binding LytR/AlgR family response regulator